MKLSNSIYDILYYNVGICIYACKYNPLQSSEVMHAFNKKYGSK